MPIRSPLFFVQYVDAIYSICNSLIKVRDTSSLLWCTACTTRPELVAYSYPGNSEYTSFLLSFSALAGKVSSGENLNSVCAGTAERISKVQLAIYRKMLVPFRQVLDAVISCPLIQHNSSTREDILQDKRHKGSSIPILNCNNKALIASSLDPSKTPLMWNKLSFIIFFCGLKRSYQSRQLCLVRLT